VKRVCMDSFHDVLDGCPPVPFMSAISSGVQELAHAHNMLVVLSAFVRIV
jgi:hypothetical protein